MTFWKSRYAAGARLIAVPGWPLPTFCTASIASTRTVSTALSSSSVQSSEGGVLTMVLSGVQRVVRASGSAMTEPTHGDR